MQVDGGPENWNKLVIAAMIGLFRKYPGLEEAYLSRLGVGHTHTDIDNLYSHVNTLLHGKSANAGRKVVTRREFEILIKEAIQTKPSLCLLDTYVEDLKFTFDFWKHAADKDMLDNRCKYA